MATEENSMSDKSARETVLAINKMAQRFFTQNLSAKEGARGLRYFRERALSDESICAFGLGYAGSCEQMIAAMQKRFSKQELLESGLFRENDDGTLWCRMTWRVTYPICDSEGRIVAFGGRVLGDAKPKYLNSAESAAFEKRQCLYAWDKAVRSGKEYVILCEGYMDVIAMHQAGFTNAVASLGTALTPQQAELIKSFADYAVILYDTDTAGQTATEKAIDILKAAGVSPYVTNALPCKDPDELLRLHGKDGLEKKIKHPMMAGEFIVKRAWQESQTNYQKVVDVLLGCSDKERQRIVKNI